MKIEWPLVAYGWRRVSGRRPILNGASSPRVSLARTSPRTRYCCPRLLGSTWSRMSPSRRPPERFLLRLVCATVLRRATVCAMPGPAPRKHAPPQAVYPRRLYGGQGVLSCHLVNSGRIFGAEASPRVAPAEGRCAVQAHGHEETWPPGMPLAHELSSSPIRTAGKSWTSRSRAKFTRG